MDAQVAMDSAEQTCQPPRLSARLSDDIQELRTDAVAPVLLVLEQRYTCLERWPQRICYSGRGRFEPTLETILDMPDEERDAAEQAAQAVAAHVKRKATQSPAFHPKIGQTARALQLTTLADHTHMCNVLSIQ